MNHVFIFEQFDFQTLKWFEQIPDFIIHHQNSFSNKESYPTNIEALIIRSGTKVNKELLGKFPHLRLIVSSTSGFDHINHTLCKERDVITAYTPSANATSAAELTWSLILACSRNLIPARNQARDGNWQRQHLTGLELSGRHLGIVGLGRVGSQVAKIANAFDMRVSAFDPYQDDPQFKRYSADRMSLEELIKTVDVLTIHVPRSSETHRMFTASTFEFIHRGIIFVNTSRGSVLDEQDLHKAVEKGWIRAAGLDVYRKEPLPKHSPLLRNAKILCTPHIGARTEAALQKASIEASKKVIQFLRTGQIHDTLPPNAPWCNDTSC